MNKEMNKTSPEKFEEWKKKFEGVDITKEFLEDMIRDYMAIEYASWAHNGWNPRLGWDYSPEIEYLKILIKYLEGQEAGQ